MRKAAPKEPGHGRGRDLARAALGLEGGECGSGDGRIAAAIARVFGPSRPGEEGKPVPAGTSRLLGLREGVGQGLGVAGRGGGEDGVIEPPPADRGERMEKAMPQSEYGKYIREHPQFFNGPEKVAAFLTGCYVSTVMGVQYRARDGATPFGKKFFGRLMTRRLLHRLYLEGQDKLAVYDKLGFVIRGLDPDLAHAWIDPLPLLLHPGRNPAVYASPSVFPMRRVTNVRSSSSSHRPYSTVVPAIFS